MASYKFDLKAVLLGKVGSGKTSLVERFINDHWEDERPCTIGAAFASKKMNYSNKQFTFGIWDTAGSERFEAIANAYYRHAYAALICFDLTDKESFDKLKYWATEVRSNEPNCKIYLVGTKADLIKNESDRIIAPKTMKDFAKEIDAVEVFETSSKEGVGIKEIFEHICQNYNVNTHQQSNQNSSSVTLSNSKPQPKKSCCS